MVEARNVDQLRHSIDQGQTGDKVRASDPAAAPLGTDAEAGGVSPTPGEIALDAAAMSREGLHRAPLPGPLIYLGLIVLVFAAIVAIMSVAGA